jgi:hypothetical protein
VHTCEREVLHLYLDLLVSGIQLKWIKDCEVRPRTVS